MFQWAHYLLLYHLSSPYLGKFISRAGGHQSNNVPLTRVTPDLPHIISFTREAVSKFLQDARLEPKVQVLFSNVMVSATAFRRFEPPLDASHFHLSCKNNPQRWELWRFVITLVTYRYLFCHGLLHVFIFSGDKMPCCEHVKGSKMLVLNWN